jgi:hypothetical protein
VQSPCNPLIQDYTEVIYMIHEGDVPSVRYKRSLRGFKSMRKADGLSFILNYFYVPALTPRLSNAETSLQLLVNGLSHVMFYLLGDQARNASYILYSVGNRMETCGAPTCISLSIDI